MLIKTIEDKENGKKWEIFKKTDNEYFYKYYEHFKKHGWRLTLTEGNEQTGYFTKDAIEWEFDLNII